jgi:hypothetical protein
MGLRWTASDRRFGEYPDIQVLLQSGEVKMRMNGTVGNGELFLGLAGPELSVLALIGIFLFLVRRA